MKTKMFVQGMMLAAFLLSCFAMPVATAQGEWKWAHFWSGRGDHETTDNIVRTAFDEEGNIYVFGKMGGQPIYNGQTFEFTEYSNAFAGSKEATMLAKFDTLGNMLWYKVVKSSDMDASPHWMEIKGDRVYISFNMSLDYVDWYGTVNNVWVYYFDTLVTGQQVHEIPVEQRRPPYKTGRYTCFATFDLDGNLLDNHFVETRARKINAGNRAELGLCSFLHAHNPFHVDREGNTYVFATLQYSGSVNDPYTIIVDSDTNRIYDVYLPGDVGPSYGQPLETGMMYKFSPDWELLYARPMVDHTEGIATSAEWGDSINPHYTFWMYGLSFDEEDNMYITGRLSLSLFGEFGGDLHQYPVRIYWDSTHFVSMLDISSAKQMGFVVKYDTNGVVQWCNQTFTRGDDNNHIASAFFGGSCVYDGSVFILGGGGYISGLVFFDDESHPLQPYQQSTANQAFFVRYDAQTGHYLNQGVVPEGNVLPGMFPSVINNRVFSWADPHTTDKICQWRDDGWFIQLIDINHAHGNGNDPSVLVNDRGYLLYSEGGLFGSVIFSSSVAANCTPGRSNAVFALYHDPEFATPYVGIADRGETLSNLKVWPNPTSNILYVESADAPIDYITIMDLNGKTLVKECVGNSSASVDVSRLPAGTYLLETVREGEVSVEKFVKTN